MSKIGYEECFGSAKSIANIIPIAMNGGAEIRDVKQAIWGVAHLIEMGWTDVEDSFQESVQAGAAALAEERAAGDRRELTREASPAPASRKKKAR